MDGDLNDYTVQELKAALKDRGLKQTGLKAELVKRLEEALKTEQDGPKKTPRGRRSRRASPEPRKSESKRGRSKSTGRKSRRSSMSPPKVEPKVESAADVVERRLNFDDVKAEEPHPTMTITTTTTASPKPRSPVRAESIEPSVGSASPRALREEPVVVAVTRPAPRGKSGRFIALAILVALIALVLRVFPPGTVAPDLFFGALFLGVLVFFLLIEARE